MTCEKCHAGEMRQASIRRFSPVLATIGYVMWGAVALLIGLPILGSFVAQRELGTSNLGASEGCALFAIGAVCLPIFIVGLLLTLKKKVWRCASCGYVFDRA